jgi:hypothetical protein
MDIKWLVPIFLIRRSSLAACHCQRLGSTQEIDYSINRVPVIAVTLGGSTKKTVALRVTMDSPIKVASTLATMISKLLKT